MIKDIKFEPKHVNDINSYVKSLIEDRQFLVLAGQKTATVSARRAKPGEIIKTEIDGTINQASMDKLHPDWVVTNPGGEKYIVKDEVFRNIYEKVDATENTYRKSAIQLLVPCHETVSFEPAWGGNFTVEAGGYFTINGYKDIAGIQKDAFKETYQLVNAPGFDPESRALSMLNNEPEIDKEME